MSRSTSATCPRQGTSTSDVLGLTERADRPDFSFDGAWLDAGSQQIHLIKADVPPEEGQHFALAVTDLDGAVAELRGRGLRVTDPAPVGTGRQSFLYDPAGNRIELQEPGGAGPGERSPWNPPVARPSRLRRGGLGGAGRGSDPPGTPRWPEALATPSRRPRPC